MLQQAVSDGSGRRTDVKKIMDTWTLQMNYPVVMVTVINGKVRVQQKRFTQNPTAKDPLKYVSKFGYVVLVYEILIQSVCMINRVLLICVLAIVCRIKRVLFICVLAMFVFVRKRNHVLQCTCRSFHPVLYRENLNFNNLFKLN
jgi:hypothetical protein